MYGSHTEKLIKFVFIAVDWLSWCMMDWLDPCCQLQDDSALAFFFQVKIPSERVRWYFINISTFHPTHPTEFDKFNTASRHLVYISPLIPSKYYSSGFIYLQPRDNNAFRVHLESTATCDNQRNRMNLFKCGRFFVSWKTPSNT